MAFLGADQEKALSVREIARVLSVSENHLAKVMQRLAREGLVESVRGPKGGFRVKGSPEEISLLDVYEAIDGPLRVSRCLFPAAKCRHGGCILGDLVETVNLEVKEHLARTRLSQVSGVFGRSDADHAEDSPHQ
jgi:Rrf2 family protein